MVDGSGHVVVNVLSTIYIRHVSVEDLGVEVVEPLVDVPVKPLLLLLDQMSQLRLRHLPLLLIPVGQSVFCKKKELL